MACRCAPALLELRAELNARWPERDRASDGCCGDAAHAARKSDHNPDAAGYAHALDVDEDLRPGLQNGGLQFLVLVLLADPRTKYVIYEGRIYYPGSAPRAYTGSNAHLHHLHLSIKAGSTHDRRPWLGGTTDMLTPQEIDAIADRVVAKLNAEATLAEGIPADHGLARLLARTDQRAGDAANAAQAAAGAASGGTLHGTATVTVSLQP